MLTVRSIVRSATAVGIALAVLLSTPSSFSGSPSAFAEPAPGEVAVNASGPMLVGAASSNWRYFDTAVGPVDIYRDFDAQFSYDTWTDTAAYAAHPNATANEYSFKINPKRLIDASDPINMRLRAFIATTPKNIIITNYHEPERFASSVFSPAQYRAGLVELIRMVRTQNSLDGGTRRVTLILMNITFKGGSSTTPADWWPTVARDGAQPDLVSADVYALPHATGTVCCPRGYTDGLKWQKPAYILKYVRNFASQRNVAWSVSELGYLEDVNDPRRRAQALADAIEYGRVNGADHMNYFDATGPRADWRLRWGTPVGTDSISSPAFLSWRTLVREPGVLTLR